MNRYLSFSLVVSLFFGLASSAEALSIRIAPDNNVYTTSDAVLGENSEERVKAQTPREVKLAPNSKRRIILDSKKDSVSVNLDDDEATEVQRVQVELPAGQNPKQRKAEIQNEERKANFKEMIKLEREKRFEEKIELTNKATERGDRIELKSREIKARFPNHPVSIDPVTKEITVQLKNGETRVLTTLPDQVLERLKAKGITADTEGLEIEVGDSNELRYTTRIEEKKRFLGILSRRIEKKVSLDDASGEITTEEIQGSTRFERFLDRFSI